MHSFLTLGTVSHTSWHVPSVLWRRRTWRTVLKTLRLLLGLAEERAKIIRRCALWFQEEKVMGWSQMFRSRPHSSLGLQEVGEKTSPLKLIHFINESLCPLTNISLFLLPLLI